MKKDLSVAAIIVIVGLVIGFLAMRQCEKPPVISVAQPQYRPLPDPAIILDQIKKSELDCIWNETGKRYRCFYDDRRGAKVFIRKDGKRLIKPYGETGLRRDRS